MNANNIYIVGFPMGRIESDKETASAIDALFNKYQEKANVLAAVVDVSNSGGVKNVVTRHSSGAMNGGDDVGVYLIFHTQGGYSRLFRGQQRNPKANREPAMAACNLLRERLQITHIRKLCLLACFAGNTQRMLEGDEVIALEAFCEATRNVFDQPPMIAGWDSFVTIRGDAHKSIDHENTGVMSDEDRYQHKVIKVFEQGNWVTKRYNEGWSKKRIAAVEFDGGNGGGNDNGGCCICF